ncbi:hypothetical protein ES703_14545 [subsurface metagenome]
MPQQTFYPDAHEEVSSVDGFVMRTGSGSWGSVRDGAGTDSGDDVETGHIWWIRSTINSNWYEIIRTIFLFNTGNLPDDCKIISAILSIYGTDKYETGAWGCAGGVFESAPANNISLGNGDYNALLTTLLSNKIALGDWNPAGYNDFILNEVGLSKISKTGITKLGIREANYDAPNSPPSWKESKIDRVTGYFSEGGTGYKPKLVVTYSIPVNAMFFGCNF